MNSNQAKLLLIISIFIIPFVISFFLLDDFAEDKKWQTTNYGKLLNPILPIANIDIKTSYGIDNTNSFNGKWSLLYYLKDDCLNPCEENIYLLRQVNSALGKDMNRLQRIIMFDDNIKVIPDLPRLRISSLDPAEIDYDFMDVLETYENFMPHLHLSLQHLFCFFFYFIISRYNFYCGNKVLFKFFFIAIFFIHLYQKIVHLLH